MRAKCTCVVTIGAPEDLCRAAHELGIELVELLHGMGYTPMPWGYEQREREALPDVILSLDPVSSATFSDLANRGIDVIEIPHPWLSRFDSAESLSGAFANAPRVRGEGTKTILVSLQWGYDGDFPPYDGILENGIISRALERVIERTQGSVRWLLRLHPLQLRNRRYRHHIEYCKNLVRRTNNSEWRDASTLPIPMLLKVCDAHVTMGSMTTYEAAHLGIPTLLLCPSVHEGGIYESMFADLRIEGYAEVGSVNDEDAIVRWAIGASCVGARRAQTHVSWESAVQRLLGRVYK